jgi:hypothetical protein
MRPLTCFWLGLLFVVLFQTSNAQDSSNVPCSQVHAIARMSQTKSLSALVKAKGIAGNSYRSEIVFRARSFQLQPSNRNAGLALLNLLPKNDDVQHEILMTLGESLCDDEGDAEMFSLSRIRDGLGRDFANAAILVPEMLPRYIAYASISVQDPHSDYAVQMQAVCRAKHSEFVKAVEGLQTDRRDWFVKHVFNPEGCHALALPEGE